MPDIDDPIGDTLGPAEALDSDEVRNDDGDIVVEPPDDWSEADKFGMTAREQREGESLDARLAEEEPDVQPDDVQPDDVQPDDVQPDDVQPDDIGDGSSPDRPGRAHRGQISGTPEDGDSLYDVVE